jgi:hypothetical protein
LHMATKASRSCIMSYYGLFCPELAFRRTHIRANGRNDEIICMGNLCAAPGKIMETRAWFIRLPQRD